MAVSNFTAATLLNSVVAPKPIVNSQPPLSAIVFPKNGLFSVSQPKFNSTHIIEPISDSGKWRNKVSFFAGFFIGNTRDVESLKEQLFETIAPLDRGAEATPENQQRVDQVKIFFLFDFFFVINIEINR